MGSTPLSLDRWCSMPLLASRSLKRQQKIVVVEVARAVQLVGLAHQVPMDLENLRIHLEKLRLVRHDVERDARTAAGIEIDLLEILAGKHRRIDQRFERHRLESRQVPFVEARFERRAELPAFRKLRGSHPPGSDAQNSRQDRATWRTSSGAAFPCDRRAALFALDGCQVLRFDVECVYARRNLDVEGVDIGGVARPLHRFPAGADFQAGEIVQRPVGRMRARNPARIEKDHWPGPGYRNRLADAIDTVIEVGGVDFKTHHARVRNVFRRLDSRRHRHRLRRPARPLSIRQTDYEQEDENAAHCVFQWKPG